MVSLVQVREYEGDTETKINFHNPRNTVAVEFFFRGEKMAKVMGSLVSLLDFTWQP
jgi:cleavage and polyadenylation specificity factor subunit 3